MRNDALDVQRQNAGMDKDPDARAKTLFQVLGILGLAGILFVLLHKGFADVSAIARDHPDTFWSSLARYLFRNLAGG
jgi:hypothetical protein